jgi:Protein of unknown function (DUF4244)
MTGISMTRASSARHRCQDLPHPQDLPHAQDLRRALVTRFDRLRGQVQAGMTTAEYAVGTLAACAFAATLLVVVRSGAIKSALSGLIASALSIAS